MLWNKPPCHHFMIFYAQEFLCPSTLHLAVAYKKSERARQNHISLYAASSTFRVAGEGHIPACSEERHFKGRTRSPGSWQFGMGSLMPPATLDIKRLARLGASILPSPPTTSRSEAQQCQLAAHPTRVRAQGRAETGL